jgi:hypothetical protein
MGYFHLDEPLDVGFPCPGWQQKGCCLVEGCPLEPKERLVLQALPLLVQPVRPEPQESLGQQGLEPEALEQRPQVLPQEQPLPWVLASSLLALALR